MYLQYIILGLLNLPGHGLVPQVRESTASPTQGKPPPTGAGLLQARVRICIPPPHVLEHAPNLPNRPQLPSTMKCQIILLLETVV